MENKRRNYTFPHQGECGKEKEIPKGVEKDFTTICTQNAALNINAFVGIINSTLYLAAVIGHRETNKKKLTSSKPEKIKLRLCCNGN